MTNNTALLIKLSAKNNAAAHATMRLAATTGFAPSIRPYSTHITAAKAWIQRSLAGAEKK